MNRTAIISVLMLLALSLLTACERDLEPLSLSPALSTLRYSETQSFNVSGPAASLNWEASGGDFIDINGPEALYRAPQKTGVYILSVSDEADPTRRASARVVVEAPQPETEIKVVAAGDIACSPDVVAYNDGDGTETQCRMRYTAELAERLAPDAVFVLGDLQYENGEYDKFLKSYDPTWGRFKAITYPVPGNHEYAQRSADGYYQYFGERAGDPSKGYYSFDLETWHVVALNTNLNCEEINCGAGSQQEQWLRTDLTANRQACSIAMLHHPRFSSGARGENEAVTDLWAALHDSGVDIVLSAHDHQYERYALQDENGVLDPVGGLRAFTVGTGGKSLYPFFEQAETNEAYVFGVFGVLELTLFEDSYAWAFISEDGRTLDSGREACR